MDKRQYERTKIEPIEMVFDEVEGSRAKHQNVTVCIEEVSSLGMRFTANVDFTANELLHFHLPSIGVLFLFTGQIAWKKVIGAELYHYGLDILNKQQ